MNNYRFENLSEHTQEMQKSRSTALSRQQKEEKSDWINLINVGYRNFPNAHALKFYIYSSPKI